MDSRPETSAVARPGRRIATACLRWGVAVAVLAWLGRENAGLLRELATRSPRHGWLALAFAAAGLGTAVSFLRWWVIARSQGFDFRLRDAVRLGLVGQLMSYVAPGVSGDVVRTVLVARDRPDRRLEAAATIVVDRYLGLLGLFWTGGIAGLALSDAVPAFRLAGRLCAAAAVLGTIALPVAFAVAAWMPSSATPETAGRLRRRFGELAAVAAGYRRRPALLASALAMAVAGHVSLGLCFYAVVLGLRHEAVSPSLLEHLTFLCGSQLTAIFAPTPGGLGATEAAVRYAYGLSATAAGRGIDPEAARGAGFAAAMTFRLVGVAAAAAGVLALRLLDPAVALATAAVHRVRGTAVAPSSIAFADHLPAGPSDTPATARRKAA